MIIQSEYSKTARSKYKQGMLKLKKLKKQEIFSVIRVDKVKGYIDLSKKGIKPTDIKEIEDKFEKGKKVQSLLYPLCDILEVNMEDLYKMIVWPLQTETEHSYDALHRAVFNFEEVIGPLNLPLNIKDKLESELKRKFTPQPTRIKAIIELKCFDKLGIEKIKEALNAGLSESSEDFPIKINLIAPPLFTVQTTTMNKEVGVEVIQRSLLKIKEVMSKYEGRFEEKEFIRDANHNENNYEKLLEMNKKEIIEEEDESDDDDDETMGRLNI